MATVLGGTGADTLDFNKLFSTPPSLAVLILSLIDFATTVDDSTIRGGTGADTLTVTGVSIRTLCSQVELELIRSPSPLDPLVPASTPVPETTASIFSSIQRGGTGNTYYFGASDGNDTLSFGVFTAGSNLTIAVDAAYGATSGFEWSAGAFTRR